MNYINNKGKLTIFSPFLPRYRKGVDTTGADPSVQSKASDAGHRPGSTSSMRTAHLLSQFLADLLLQPQGWRDGSFRDPDLIPSTHAAAHIVTPVSRDPMPSFGLFRHQDACTDMQAGKISIYIK